MKIIGNKNNKSYHLDSCKFAPKSSMKIEEFKDVAEAKTAGYKACSTCNPDNNFTEDIEGFEPVKDTSDLPFGDDDFTGMNPPVESNETDENKVEESKEVLEHKENITIVGNSSNKSYHLDSCKFAPKNASKRVEFKNIEEAKAEGYKACSTCNPDK